MNLDIVDNNILKRSFQISVTRPNVFFYSLLIWGYRCRERYISFHCDWGLVIPLVFTHTPHLWTHVPQTHFPPAHLPRHLHTLWPLGTHHPRTLGSPLPTQGLPAGGSGILLALQGSHRAVKALCRPDPWLLLGFPSPTAFLGVFICSPRSRFLLGAPLPFPGRSWARSLDTHGPLYPTNPVPGLQTSVYPGVVPETMHLCKQTSSCPPVWSMQAVIHSWNTASSCAGTGQHSDPDSRGLPAALSLSHFPLPFLSFYSSLFSGTQPCKF